MIQPVKAEEGTAVDGGSNDIYLNPSSIHAALSSAVREARLRHKLLGQPVVEWRDGQVVLVPAEEIEIVEPNHASKTSDESQTP
jgi:hypothetical protein